MAKCICIIILFTAVARYGNFNEFSCRLGITYVHTDYKKNIAKSVVNESISQVVFDNF